MRTRIKRRHGLEQLEDRRLFAGLEEGADAYAVAPSPVLVSDGETVVMVGIRGGESAHHQ